MYCGVAQRTTPFASYSSLLTRACVQGRPCAVWLPIALTYRAADPPRRVWPCLARGRASGASGWFDSWFNDGFDSGFGGDLDDPFDGRFAGDFDGRLGCSFDPAGDDYAAQPPPQLSCPNTTVLPCLNSASSPHLETTSPSPIRNA
jgi:hypothetical protein